MKKLFVYTAALVALILFPNFIGAQTLTWDETNAARIEQNIGDAADPQIAISGDTVVAVWKQYDGTSDRIYSNYSTDGGETWSDTQLIENNVGCYGGYPQVAISESNVVAVWHQFDDSSEHIYSNYSTDGGVTWIPGNTQLIENNAGHNGENPQVAISGGTVVAVWRQHDGTSNRIYSNYSTNGGVTWIPGNTQLIENNAGHNGENPQVAIFDSNVVAVWQQYDGSNNRIYSNYTTISAGAVIWDTTKVDTVSNGDGGGNNPQIAISGDNVVAVWQQSDGTNDHIYSNHAQVMPDIMTGDYGSLPVGPLAVSISALLVWWKRRKQRQG